MIGRARVFVVATWATLTPAVRAASSRNHIYHRPAFRVHRYSFLLGRRNPGAAISTREPLVGDNSHVIGRGMRWIKAHARRNH
jgi:hypothetical protein